MKKKIRRIFAVFTLILFIVLITYFCFTCKRFNFSFAAESLDNVVFRSDNSLYTLIFDDGGNAVYSVGETSLPCELLEVSDREFVLISGENQYRFAVLDENEILCMTFGKKLERIEVNVVEEKN